MTQFTRLEDSWESGEKQRAVCGKALEFDHQAPFSGCSCGLYAFYDWETCCRYADGAASRGVVSAWGDLILCEYGFKAEYMRVEALLFDVKPYLNSSGAMWHYATTIKPTYEAVAERYNVPLIDVETLPSFLEELGGEILSPDPQPEEETSVPRVTGLPWAKGFRGPTTSTPPKPLKSVYWISVGVAALNVVIALWQVSVLVEAIYSPDTTPWQIILNCVFILINSGAAWWVYSRRFVRSQ